MNYTDIFCSSWIYNTGVNTYITCTLNEYTKDRNINPDNYVTADKKPIKVNLYKTSIIAVNTPNGPNIIIFANTAYCFIFLANITSIKCFQFKKIYLDKKHNQLYKKKITQYFLKEYNRNFFL